MSNNCCVIATSVYCSCFEGANKVREGPFMNELYNKPIFNRLMNKSTYSFCESKIIKSHFQLNCTTDATLSNLKDQSKLKISNDIKQKFQFCHESQK